ncbi:MAG: RNA polymerase sigma factor [Candidatus Binatia bacterium]
MAAVATGDPRALEALCRRYERPLHQFLWRHLGGRDVEDLHQETWLRVVRSAGRFDRRRRFSTWLFQIATNLCRDWHRRPPAEPSDPATLDAPTPDTAERQGAALDAARLLAALPEPQRAAVLLRYYHDLPEEEVAEILGCPRGTVKSRLHNAMTTLKTLARAT